MTPIDNDNPLFSQMMVSAIRMGELITPLLEEGKSCRLICHGDSMHPFIRSGDSITLKPCEGENLCAGSVVAYRHPQSKGLLIHRVVRVRKGRLLMKGDNCLWPDAEITGDRVAGIVSHVERNRRTVRFGLGRERKWIALLSRLGVIGRLFSKAGSLLKALRP